MYLGLYVILVFVRSIAFFYYRKDNLPSLKMHDRIIQAIWSNALIGFTIVFILSITRFTSIPRTFALQIILYPFFIDLVYAGLKTRGSRCIVNKRAAFAQSISSKRFSLPLGNFLCGMFSIFFAYHTISYIKYHDIVYHIYTLQVFFLVSLIWFLSTIFTQKYNIDNSDGVYIILGQHVKATILSVLALGVPLFFFRLDHLSRYLLFGTAILASIFELVVSIFKFYYERSTGEFLHSIDDIVDDQGVVKQDYFSTDDPFASNLLLSDYFEKFTTLITTVNKLEIKPFLQRCSESINTNSSSIAILSAATTETINLQSNLSTLINFHRCNDQRHLNKYLIACHNSLNSGGILVGYFEPLEVVNRNLRKELPRILYWLGSPAHFLFHRVLPKLMLTNFIYFFITRGKNRILSKAEMFGRLNYCGFEIIAELPSLDMTAFIARKSKSISSELKPSFNAIVRLKRIGYHGKIINIYKIRTMHPYSEFLQQYIYNNQSIEDTGKFKNDFRLTSWGKMLRKMWIDELPQIYNWIRGDVKIVGVRALSAQYYSLYPEELQQLRIKTKPGLIPPYYVDMPKSFDEIMASERNYIQKYLEKPIRTDIIYFFKAFTNIILKGARSA